MPIAGQEIIRGFIPSTTYTVLFKETEKKKSSKTQHDMIVVKAEILGPELVEHGGRQYNVLGLGGDMYFMLNNKNGVDAALSVLSPQLRKLGFYDIVPAGTEYGATEVADFLLSLKGRKVNMIVSCQTRYMTASSDPNDAFDPAKAIRDPDTNEPIVAGHRPIFEVRGIMGIVPSADNF